MRFSLCIKWIFDRTMSLFVMILFLPLLLVLFVVHKITMGGRFFFLQRRFGRHGRQFTMIKIRSMENDGTTPPFGRWLRKTKIDEIPELINIFIGDMSFVGWRPDLPHYFDMIPQEKRFFVSFRPGLICPATLKYKNEERILSQQENPLKFNDTVIFPDKIDLNVKFYSNWNIGKDLTVVYQFFCGKN